MKTTIFITLFFLLTTSFVIAQTDSNIYVKRSSLKKTSYPYWVESVAKNGGKLGENDSHYLLIKSSGNKITELYKMIGKRDELITLISFTPNKWSVGMVAYTKGYANIMFNDFMSIDPDNYKPISKAATERHFNANHNGAAMYTDMDALCALTGEDISKIYKVSVSNVKIIY